MQTIVRRETRKRGVFGKTFKVLFILFNVLMAIWTVSYWGTVGQQINGYTSDIQRNGAAIGATLGTTFIIFFWAAGSAVLGLLTMLSRGTVTVIEERVSP
jgi:NADH:ubiquinone oxidoreductase subunit 6 (subunit J)